MRVRLCFVSVGECSDVVVIVFGFLVIGFISYCGIGSWLLVVV